jgi:hypothetical protein
MTHLTLQEVIDRINNSYPFRRETNPAAVRTEIESPHRPEFYVPRIARLFVSLLLGA